MPRRKPLGWPRYMVTRRLKSGTIAYYWVIPTWAKQNGCALKIEALGTDYASAKKRCDELLNPQFDAWRKREETTLPSNQPIPGTFNWLVAIYKTSPRYQDLPAKTRKSYDGALRLVGRHTLKDGREFGTLSLESVTPGAVDRLFAKLKIIETVAADGDSKVITVTRERTRTAVLAMRVCHIAWKTARRDKPGMVPATNPFADMKLAYKAKKTRPVNHAELMNFVKAADNAGEASLGTAAMIAFYWLQRETDILARLAWNHYKPADAPDMARIFHHKTGDLVELPLYDNDGTVLWPELVERLDSAPRFGTLIVMRDKPDRRRKVHLPWKEDYFRHRVAEIRAAAGIDPEAKFMGLRHGGNTEGADAGLTDAQLRALSGHRSANMPIVYARQTMNQRRTAARKRLEQRTKGGHLSK